MLQRRLGALLLAGVAALIASACGGGDASRESRRAMPLEPSAVSAGPSPASGTDGARGRTGAAPGAAVRLPPDALAATPSTVLFPPRDESFAFRNALEAKYRDGLRRAATSTHVDIEGDVVWTQEYLRYRVNGCHHADSVRYVIDEIDGRAAAPVCGEARGGVVPFPPRDESYAFRLELERTYRDVLRRPASVTFVDAEGSLVWVQEYLRYRVNACGHAVSEAKVFDQIDGRGIAPDCVPPPMPAERTLTGYWHGTSTFWNAPFEMDLVQRGTRVSGWYQDRKDRGSVSEYPGPDEVTLLVYFGDAGLILRGRFTGDFHVEGTINHGGHSWPFVMVK